jgi:hypothetical protein
MKADKTSSFYKHVLLLVSRLAFVVFPTFLSLSLARNSYLTEAGFVVVIYLYLSLARALIPFGMDLFILQNIFFEDQKSARKQYSIENVLNFSLKTFLIRRLALGLVLVLATDLTRSHFNIEASNFLNVILFGVYLFSGFNAILLSFFRNSRHNVSSQLVDGFFTSFAPALISILLIPNGLFSLDIVALALFISQIFHFVLMLSKIKTHTGCSLNLNYSKNLLEPQRIKSMKIFLTVSIITINSRLALLLVGWILEPQYLILFDVLLKIYFLASLSMWSNSILRNKIYVTSSLLSVKKSIEKQSLVASFFYLSGYVFLLITHFYSPSFQNLDVENLVFFVGVVFLAHLLDIPSGILGYIFTAKSEYNIMLTGQLIYFLTLFLSVFFINSWLAFLFFLFLGHILRTTAYLISYYKKIIIQQP